MYLYGWVAIAKSMSNSEFGRDHSISQDQIVVSSSDCRLRILLVEQESGLDM